jgi:hypothetical protein
VYVPAQGGAGGSFLLPLFFGQTEKETPKHVSYECLTTYFFGGRSTDRGRRLSTPPLQAGSSYVGGTTLVASPLLRHVSGLEVSLSSSAAQSVLPQFTASLPRTVGIEKTGTLFLIPSHLSLRPSPSSYFPTPQHRTPSAAYAPFHFISSRFVPSIQVKRVKHGPALPGAATMNFRPSTSTTDAFRAPVYKPIPAGVRITPTYSDGWVANTLPAIRPVTPDRHLPERTANLRDPQLGLGKGVSVSHSMFTWKPPDPPRDDASVSSWEPCNLSFQSSVRLGPAAPSPRALVPGRDARFFTVTLVSSVHAPRAPYSAVHTEYVCVSHTSPRRGGTRTCASSCSTVVM